MLLVRDLGQASYIPVMQDMRAFTLSRTADTPDELWFVEHAPVFTQGQAGKPEHILDAHDIPIVQSDRGGQVTYHGPGQITAYPLVDLNRYHLGVRDWVCCLEKAVIKTLAHYGLEAVGRRDAPGVYIDEKKICSIGLRVRKGRAYHGISFNIDMDLKPFSYINPCGFSNLKMAQLSDYLPGIKISDVQPILRDNIAQALNITNIQQEEMMA